MEKEEVSVACEVAFDVGTDGRTGVDLLLLFSLHPLPSRSPWGMNARDPGLVLHCTGKFIGIGYSMEHSF